MIALRWERVVYFWKENKSIVFTLSILCYSLFSYSGSTDLNFNSAWSWYSVACQNMKTLDRSRSLISDRINKNNNLNLSWNHYDNCNDIDNFIYYENRCGKKVEPLSPRRRQNIRIHTVQRGRKLKTWNFVCGHMTMRRTSDSIFVILASSKVLF